MRYSVTIFVFINSRARVCVCFSRLYSSDVFFFFLIPGVLRSVVLAQEDGSVFELGPPVFRCVTTCGFIPEADDRIQTRKFTDDGHNPISLDCFSSFGDPSFILLLWMQLVEACFN